MCGPAGGGTGCDGTAGADAAGGAAGMIDGAFDNRASPAWGVAVLRAAAAAASASRFFASIWALSAAGGEPDGGDTFLWAMAAKFLPLGLPPDPGDPVGGVLGAAPAAAAPVAVVGLFLPPGGVDARCCAWSG